MYVCVFAPVYTYYCHLGQASLGDIFVKTVSSDKCSLLNYQDTYIRVYANTMCIRIVLDQFSVSGSWGRDICSSIYLDHLAPAVSFPDSISLGRGRGLTSFWILFASISCGKIRSLFRLLDIPVADTTLRVLCYEISKQTYKQMNDSMNKPNLTEVNTLLKGKHKNAEFIQ